MFKEKWAPLRLSHTQQIYGKKSKLYYIQGWLHNLHGPVQNKNVELLVQEAEKSIINSNKKLFL